jgi:hypothetical protein
VATAVAAAALATIAAERPRASAPAAGGRELARQDCATCHPVPAPDVLPRALWRAEIEKMAMLAEGKPMPGWGEPRPPVTLSAEYQRILAYYEAEAPVALASPQPWPAPPATGARFVRRGISFPDALTAEPAVSNVRLLDLDGDGRPELLATDMRQGVVLVASGHPAAATAAAVAAIPNPAHVSVADLDADGRRDLLVADLGQFLPSDAVKGAAVWLRAQAGGGFAPFREDGFARATDVEAGDFDGDGRLDLVVAAFGWWQSGNVTLLLNRGAGAGPPRLERRVIDDRPGAIHVLPTDVDGDGKLDIVALLAQESEQVVAYLGDGQGGFRAQTLYAAPHPNWGSTGILLADFDGDGDADIVVTNGDMFDDGILKPYHGIQWLENKGKLRFEPHALAPLAGVHRAVVADLDGDGDLDVAACALVLGAPPAVARALPSLVWLEQVRRGRFERRTIETGNATHATLDAGDVDGDGDVDLYVVVGGEFPGDGFLDALFVNPGSGNRWVTLRLTGTRSNRSAIGARLAVRVRTDAGSRDIHRVVGSGGSFGASTLQQEIGLGAATAIERVTVRWPSGATEEFTDVPLDSVVALREGSGRK